MSSGRHRASSRSTRSARSAGDGDATTTPRLRKWHKGFLGLAAVTVLGVGVAVGPSASAENSYTGDFSMDQLDDLLNNDMILDYVEVCRNADGSTPVPEEGSEDARPVAVADCSQATGDGIAIVLPDKIELGSAAENATVDLGKDIKILGYTYKLGERNLFEILSAAALGSGTIKDIAEGLGLPRVDPTKLGEYSSYEQVRADAALPYKAAYRDVRGECNKWLWKVCIGWETVKVEYDANLEKRTNALKIAEYLTGEKYDASTPVELPDMDNNGPRGSATIAGDGISVAAAMRDGNALAEAKKLFGLPAAALAGADGGRASISHSTLGLSTALNMDTNEIGLTRFGQALDLTKLKELGIDEYAGDEAMGMLDTAENLEIPALKEVSCFGVYTTATAEGLGSCTNILGTFDRYARNVDTLISIAPGGASTEKAVNAEILAALGSNGVFVNIGRGSTVDEDALAKALADGTIMAAGLDVFADEPNVPAGLLKAENASLLPHVGSATVHTRQAMADLVADNLFAWFGRGEVLTPVAETRDVPLPAR